MKATIFLLLAVMFIASCSEDPFFEVEAPEAPVSFRLKEQLQSDEPDCPSCRPAPPMVGGLPVPEKEQLQDQDNDEEDCCGGRNALPPGPDDLVLPLKEQLQGGEDDDDSSNCCP